MTMQLRAMVAKAAAKAWAATDAPVAVTLRRVTPGTYNPATGKTGAATTVDHTGTAIFASYKQNEVDGSAILATDRKAILRQAEFSAAGKLTTTDKLVEGGKALAIVNVQQDAVSVMWILQVRG